MVTVQDRITTRGLILGHRGPLSHKECHHIPWACEILSTARKEEEEKEEEEKWRGMQSIHEKPKSHVRCTPCEQYRTAAGTLHLQRIMSASEKHFVHTQNTYDRFSRPHKAPPPQTLGIGVERQLRLVLATDHPSLRRAPELARYGGLRPAVVCRLEEPLVLVPGPGGPPASPRPWK